jgi:thiol-disulfide isomerase/thioredoxin
MKLSLNNNYLLVAIVLFAALQSCSVQNQEAAQGKADFELTDLSGQPIDLEAYKGKTVLVNVWATWCAPCIREMPSIQNAKKMFGDRLEVLMASEEDQERIHEFLQRKPFKLRFVRLENADELELPVLPTTYIINPSGNIAFFETGARKWDEPESIALINKIAAGL